jgi:hypothetical protein
MDVSSLAGRVISQPVSIPLQNGFRFFHHLTPYLPQLALRLACPKGEGMGLPRSAYLTTDTLGPLCLPAGMLPVSDVLQALRTTHLPFGQASQLLWLVNIHDSYKCSLPLTIVSYPNPSPGWSFPERFGLTASTPSAQTDFGALSGRLHTHQGCTLSACFHRIAATGRWVQMKALYLR